VIVASTIVPVATFSPLAARSVRARPYRFQIPVLGGRHSVDAVITSATTLGPNEKFKLTTIQPDYTTIQTPLGNYVSAVGGGGLGGNFPASQILQTERTQLADDALFVLFGPGVGGNTSIRTFGLFALASVSAEFGTSIGVKLNVKSARATPGTPRSRFNVKAISFFCIFGATSWRAIIERACHRAASSSRPLTSQPQGEFGLASYASISFSLSIRPVIGCFSLRGGISFVRGSKDPGNRKGIATAYIDLGVMSWHALP
jgi:hypothetical protein